MDGDDDEDESGYEIPKGEQNEFGGMVEYIGDEFGDIDWDSFDYDDAYDDVGDEDEDSYGEDAA